MVAPDRNHEQHIERDQVADKHVGAPACSHVEVGGSSKGSRGHSAQPHSAHKEVKGGQQGKDGDGLVIKAARNTAGHVACCVGVFLGGR